MTIHLNFVPWISNHGSESAAVKIAFVSLTETHPVSDGARKRVVNLANALRERGARFTPVIARRAPSVGEDADAMLSFWGPGEFPRMASEGGGGDGVAHSIDTLTESGNSEAIRKLFERDRPDVLFINDVETLSLRDALGLDVPIVFDSHKSTTELLAFPSDETATSVDRGLLSTGHVRADLVLHPGPRDPEPSRGNWGATVLTVGHLTSPRTNRIRRLEKVESIGLVASDHHANVFGVRELVRCIDQYFGREQTQYKLFVAGSVADRIDATRSWLEKRPCVCDLDGFGEEMDIVLSPVETSDGLWVETVELLALGRPVISTVAGFEGLPVTDLAQACSAIEAMISEIYWATERPERLLELEAASADAANRYALSVASEVDDLWLELSKLVGKQATPKALHGASSKPMVGEAGYASSIRFGSAKPTTITADRFWLGDNCWRRSTGEKYWSTTPVSTLSLYVQNDMTPAEVAQLRLSFQPDVEPSAATVEVRENDVRICREAIRPGDLDLCFRLRDHSSDHHSIDILTRDDAGDLIFAPFRLERLSSACIRRQVGEELALGDPELRDHLLDGWSESEGEHVWSIAERASLRVTVSPNGGSLVLRARLRAPMGKAFRIEHRDEVLVDGVGDDSVQTVSASLRAGSFSENRVETFTFVCDALHSVEADDRRFGVCLYGVQVASVDQHGDGSALRERFA